MSRRVHVGPDTRPEMHRVLTEAVAAAGATLSPIEEAEALVWADPFNPQLFPDLYGRASDLSWVQLPFAGIGGFLDHLEPGPVWTCGKGVYALPVAEHALGLALAGLRDLHRFIPERRWGERTGRNLLGARVTILGGGGIARELIRLLGPFECDISVVRRSGEAVDGANRTVTTARAMELLPRTDVLVVAWALTPETHNWVDASVLAALPDDAWLINVGRGGHVDHSALIEALDSGSLGGAGLDVTEPEPLPPDHRLWDFDNCIITPHVGNTAEMGLPLIATRVRDNTARFLADQPLVGTIDIDAGY